MKKAIDIRLLKNIPLFEKLSSSSLLKIQKLLKTIYYKEGTRIIEEDEMGDSLFIILKGEVEVLKGKSKKKVATLRPFDFFGEMSILENKPRSASVFAKRNSELLKLSKKDFASLFTKYSKISLEIMKTLSSRIRETDLKLIEDLKKKNKELKRVNRNLKKIQQELIKAKKLSAVGKVAGGIIHDLKNPLSVVKGYAEYIGHSKEATKPLIGAASTILHEINLILNMTQELLEFSKGEYKLKKISINIDELVREIAHITIAELRKNNIDLQLKLKANCDCLIDPQMMRRVFSNITSNALDAMKNGGTFTISTSKKNKNIRIEFKDTGCGIDKETLKNIFEPFYSKTKRKGIGLGMSIAKRIIKEHKGKIEVKSKKGKGTTVTIYIPTLK